MLRVSCCTLSPSTPPSTSSGSPPAPNTYMSVHTMHLSCFVAFGLVGSVTLQFVGYVQLLDQANGVITVSRLRSTDPATAVTVIATQRRRRSSVRESLRLSGAEALPLLLGVPEPRTRAALLKRAANALNTALLTTPLSSECMMHQGIAWYLAGSAALAEENTAEAAG